MSNNNQREFDQRHIAYFALDTFFVSVERLKDRRLKGKPLVIGGANDRGVVLSCSAEARRLGIRAGMRIQQVKRLCPEAIILKGDTDAYFKYSTLITHVLKATSPLFERAAIDEFYLDLTGMDKFVGCRPFVADLRRRLFKETGLPISYALASNKLISKVATNEVRPNGANWIPFGEEKEFLAPLHVIKLPGIGRETAETLLRRGVETIGALASIDIELLQDTFGKTGTDLWNKANGLDSSPVIPYQEAQFLAAEYTLQEDTISPRGLRAVLTRLTEKLAFTLRCQNKLAGRITLKIRYSNVDTAEKQKTIEPTNADFVLSATVNQLLTKVYDRRLRVRHLAVRYTNLVPGNYQIKLYEDTQEMVNLLKAMDSIKKRFGEPIVMHAVGIIKRK